jgi:hypothetical protein
MPVTSPVSGSHGGTWSAGEDEPYAAEGREPLPAPADAAVRRRSAAASSRPRVGVAGGMGATPPPDGPAAPASRDGRRRLRETPLARGWTGAVRRGLLLLGSRVLGSGLLAAEQGRLTLSLQPGDLAAETLDLCLFGQPLALLGEPLLLPALSDALGRLGAVIAHLTE